MFMRIKKFEVDGIEWQGVLEYSWGRHVECMGAAKGSHLRVYSE